MKRSVFLLLVILAVTPVSISQNLRTSPDPARQPSASPYPCASGEGAPLNLDAWIDRLAAPEGAPAARDSLIGFLLQDVNTHHFDCVFRICARLAERFPDDPAWHLLAANGYQSMMRDYRVRIHEEKFETHIDKAIDLAEWRIKKDKRPEDYFILGSAQGYLGLHQFRKGQWLSAINGITKSIRNLRRAHARDPDFVDPLLGLALYEFGKTKVPLIPGDLDKALEYLETVVDNGRYVSVDALYSQQLIYMHLKQFDKALAVNNRLYASYPQSSVVLYNRGLLLELTGRIDAAGQIWQALIARITAFEQPSHGYLAECHLHLGENLHALGSPDRSRESLNEAARHAELYREDTELDGPYEKFGSIRKAIDKAVKERMASP